MTIKTVKQIKFFKIHKNATYPFRSTKGSVGYDIFSSEKITIYPNKIQKIKTGIKINMPHQFEAVIVPRSSISMKDIYVAYGTIESDYDKEICIICKNYKNDPFEISIGDRIAQLKFYEIPQIETVDEEGNLIQHSNQERQGGFGSTGK